MPAVPPAVPETAYPQWRASAHALLDGARIAWDYVRSGRHRGRIHINVGAIVHTEALAEPRVHAAFTELCRFFRAETGTRMLACVIPGPNPIVRGLMAAHGLDADGFRRRVEELGRDAVLGYHGHFFDQAAEGSAPPMRHANFEPTRFHEQLAEDLRWFDGIGVRPQWYTGGWWVLNRAIVDGLDGAGFRYDFTLRPSLRNTFGEPYQLDVDRIDGRPRRIGEHLWELGSFSGLWRYPADTSAWRAAADDGPAPRFFGLYFHDYDVLSYAVALRRMIRWLSRLPNLAWVAFDDLAAAGLP